MERFLKIFSVLLAAAVAILLFLAFRSDSARMLSKEQELMQVQAQMNAEAEKKEAEDKLLKEKILASLPRIVCWGDGLTAGIGGNGTRYTDTLAYLIKLKVLNYGVGGETTEQIACRQGGKKIFADAFIMPGTTSSVEIKLNDGNGNAINILTVGSEGVNPCSINGVLGEISREGDTYFFIREEPGNEISVPAKTQVYTNAMLDNKPNDIVILFSGSDDIIPENRVNNIILNQRAILDYSRSSKYIVIGLPKKADEDVNKAMSTAYGNKFFDWRKYLLENAMKDAGITPTEQDKADLKNGIVPSSLRSGDLLGNSTYYDLLGTQIYKRIIELGYLTENEVEYLGLKTFNSTASDSK